MFHYCSIKEILYCVHLNKRLTWDCPAAPSGLVIISVPVRHLNLEIITPGGQHGLAADLTRTTIGTTTTLPIAKMATPFCVQRMMLLFKNGVRVGKYPVMMTYLNCWNAANGNAVNSKALTVTEQQDLMVSTSFSPSLAFMAKDNSLKAILPIGPMNWVMTMTLQQLPCV